MSVRLLIRILRVIVYIIFGTLLIPHIGNEDGLYSGVLPVLCFMITLVLSASIAIDLVNLIHNIPFRKIEVWWTELLDQTL